ncbi:MAG TPA: hypothetical protein VM030_11810, partial [Acidimicrobiales bacterium]|nr:hypothetical protein [Acidimicrobiales bacterium]
MAVTRVRDLPLFWKLLLPFLGLIVLFGSLGAFLIVRNLSVRAQDALDQDLARRSFEARSIARDRELYLVESANFATNIQGMADAVGRSDRAAVETLLGSVLALKTDVTLLVATDDLGVGIVELRRTAGREPASSGGGQWAANRFVADALRSKAATRRAGVIRDGGVPMLVIAAPICEAADGCTVRGVAIVGIGIERLADDAAGKSA